MPLWFVTDGWAGVEKGKNSEVAESLIYIGGIRGRGTVEGPV